MTILSSKSQCYRFTDTVIKRRISAVTLFVASLLIAQGSVAAAGYTLRESISIPTGTNHVRFVGDMDGDGVLDVVVSDWDTETITVLERSAGTFVNRFTITEPGDLRGAFVAEDVDGDGLPEIVSGNSSGRLQIWEASGDNAYALRYTENLGNFIEHPNDGDSDGDGLREILVSRESFPSEIVILEATADNVYVRQPSLYGQGGNNERPRIFDLDGDGAQETLFADDSYTPTWTLYVYENGSLIFQDNQMVPIISLGDTDGDGLGEIIGFENGTHDLRVLESTGSSNNFTETIIADIGYDTRVLDADEDGKDEFWRILNNGSGQLNVFALGARTGNVITDVYNSGQLFQGSPNPIKIILAVGDTNADGYLELAVWQGNQLHILESSVQVQVITADAGPDQTVNEGAAVNLDGTGSSPVPSTLNYSWSQVAGSAVSLTGASTATPGFGAPYGSSNQVLTFELIVDDGTNFSDADGVDIVVVNVNEPPVADAGDDSTIKPGAVATLDGSNSFDPNSDPITAYQWTQASGSNVTLSNDTVQQPTFTAPDFVGGVLVFKLQVSDANESSIPSGGTDSSLADTVAITIVENSRPVADAGPDQTKDEGGVVTLNGTGSFDSDGGDILSFQWTQTGGSLVTLSSSTAAVPTFTLPAVGPGGEDLTFSLIVTDNDPVNTLASFQDDVTIHGSNINDPPSCNLATAGPGNLWPPNHKMKSVSVGSVVDSDAEYNDVTLQITTTTQDEPVSGLGDGDSSPDAVIQAGDPADSVLVRAERSGNGNGRVYSIGFVASDGFESCNGTITVTVFHSRKSGAVDDGQVYDSTQP